MSTADSGSPQAAPIRRGGCLCGAVRYELGGALRPPLACHCDECRRFTGSVWHAAAVRRQLDLCAEHVRRADYLAPDRDRLLDLIETARAAPDRAPAQTAATR